MATWEEVEAAGEELIASLRKLRRALARFDTELTDKEIDAELERREAAREAELSDEEVDAELDRLMGHD